MERLRRVRTRHEERALPHYDEAERAILGAVLLDNQAFNTATQILTPDDFFGEANRLIYEAMAGLSERSESVDTVTVRTGADPMRRARARGRTGVHLQPDRRYPGSDQRRGVRAHRARSVSLQAAGTTRPGARTMPSSRESTLPI